MTSPGTPRWAAEHARQSPRRTSRSSGSTRRQRRSASRWRGRDRARRRSTKLTERDSYDHVRRPAGSTGEYRYKVRAVVNAVATDWSDEALAHTLEWKEAYAHQGTVTARDSGDFAFNNTEHLVISFDIVSGFVTRWRTAVGTSISYDRNNVTEAGSANRSPNYQDRPDTVLLISKIEALT